ncbi:MAG TPA: VWA domain-containing protein [Vicinamibacterales bacterium]|nr:VWA domain-containing protein [Vicinamibacterales bacterium]
MRATVALCLAAAVSLALIAQQPTFRSSTQTVVVYATVRDATGRLVPDLTQDDFELLDNGTPARITTFSNDIQPITVALLLDMSGSMVSRLIRVRDSTLRFIDALRPADRVRIGTFGDEIGISPLLTADKETLTRIVREELWPGGGTPLWNAVYAGMESLAAESGRRVILVLTDGLDSESLPGWKGDFGDVRTRATREGFMLYMIGMDTVDTHDEPQRAVNALIAETGGSRFDVKEEEDLHATFARVADELRRQYLIGFSPDARDGREHRLDIRAKRPGLQAHGRKSYVAERR